MKTTRIKTALLTLTILLSMGAPICANAETISSENIGKYIVSPSAQVMVASVIIPTAKDVNASINHAREVNTFGAYQETLMLIQSLPTSEQDKYTGQIATSFSKLFTDQIKSFINDTNAVFTTPDLQKFTDLVTKIDSSNLNAYDKGYFKGQMTSWGHDRVYTPDVQAAISAIGKVWSDKTQSSIDAANSAIAMPSIPVGSFTYLNTQLAPAVLAASDSIIVTFPDKNLEKSIRSILEKPTGSLSKSDVDRVIGLDASSQNITNLSGIENLSNLQELDLSQNQISNIDFLKGLTKLTKLILDSTKITNFDSLKGLTNLTTLSLESDQINNIDSLKGLTKLTLLDLSYNQFKNIDALSAFPNLTILGLSSNQISNISPLKGLTKMTVLDLSSNLITSIDSLKLMTSLTMLDLSNNQITNIDTLRGFTSITNLLLANNKIIDYTPVSSYYKNLIEKDFVLP